MKPAKPGFTRSPALRLVTLAALVASAVLLAPRLAVASPIFPVEVQSHLGSKSLPACTLCHSTLSGGIGTAITPFGKTVKGSGASAANLGSLDGALDAMKNKHTDGDGDCVGDIDELVAGTDPNSGADNPGACDGGSAVPPTGGGATAPDPQYGCAAGAGAPVGPTSFAAAAVLGAWAWLRRARRRKT